MSFRFYLIDGLGHVPRQWEQLKLELRRAFPDAVQFIVSYEKLKYTDWSKREDSDSAIIGHSRGAVEAAKVSIVIKPKALVGLEPVRPLHQWLKRDDEPHGALQALSLRRSKLIGPKGCDLKHAIKQVIPDSDHNSIIAAATPSIVEFVRKAVAS